MGSSLFGFDHFGGSSGGGGGGGNNTKGDKERDDKRKKEKERSVGAEDGPKKMPIINPLVRLPNWPSVCNNDLLFQYIINHMLNFLPYSASQQRRVHFQVLASECGHALRCC